MGSCGCRHLTPRPAARERPQLCEDQNHICWQGTPIWWLWSSLYVAVAVAVCGCGSLCMWLWQSLCVAVAVAVAVAVSVRACASRGCGKRICPSPVIPVYQCAPGPVPPFRNHTSHGPYKTKGHRNSYVTTTPYIPQYGTSTDAPVLSKVDVLHLFHSRLDLVSYINCPPVTQLLMQFLAGAPARTADSKLGSAYTAWCYQQNLSMTHF